MEEELQGFYLERKILEENLKDSGELKENENLDFSFLKKIIVLNENNLPLLINEDFSVNLYDFLHGYCKFFSSCLHDKFGYEIINIYSNDFSIIHSFCLDEQGNFIDIRGKTTNEELFFSEFKDWINYYDWQENLNDNKTQEIENQIDKEIYSVCNLIIEQYIEFYEKIKSNKKG